MNMMNIFKITALCSALLITISSQAQPNYPTKPINFVVPYGAGGSADSRSRQIAQKMSVILKQPIIVDNKPGAGGNIGTEFVARAVPDGYTIGMGNFAPMSVNKTLFSNLRYDPETNLSPIILIEKGPLVLVVHPNSPYKTIQDIVTAAKAKPGTLTFSSGGIGGSHQLSAELFMQNAGIKMIHVPYKSGSAGLTDLPIAITSKKRSPLLPNVPSFAEVGYPKVEVLNWQGLIAPAKTPKAIIEKLNAAANEALKDPQLRELMLSQGNEIGGGTPADFAALIKSESAKWSAVVKAGNIKPE